MSSPPQHLDTIVLAGGRGERMGGQDKGWVSLGDTTFIEATLAAFTGTPIRPLISANRNLDRYREIAGGLGGLVVQDLDTSFRGPLGGLAAASVHLQSDWVFIVPCDTPQLGPCFAKRMLAAAEAEPGVDGFMASDGERTQALHCLLRKSALQQLPNFMAIPRERQPGMMAWARQLTIREVNFSDSAQMFENVNTPEALASVRFADRQCRE